MQIEYKPNIDANNIYCEEKLMQIKYKQKL